MAFRNCNPYLIELPCLQLVETEFELYKDYQVSQHGEREDEVMTHCSCALQAIYWWEFSVHHLWQPWYPFAAQHICGCYATLTS